ncbi:fructose bisphosphate aldolase [Demequina sp. SYSU T00039]|uniref:fructose-bisphosphate aldolase n=1 Tax=Demequina lignilytica TaxID=3051663 RepID=A0AAW7M880_9MICO|nr:MULTISPECIES: fructose bisphosphate aldolase [unclassified Demequina]MDN4478481.1 fructose bisphosphate aldolase [Demequina sp. SYSU T00039-1]MDN4487012.1 fructose bisphosphate aldolase [Demequina sp. SYSU T00039]
MPDAEKMARFATGRGFIAALDQSGGSTPRALRAYGIDESHYADEAQMFDLIHTARTRVMTSPVFDSDRILGAILFQGTVDRTVAGMPVVDYLWREKGILSFLKIDKGLEDEQDGVRLMKDIPGLDATLADAAARGVFGTKERSVIGAGTDDGVRSVVAQQFEVAERVLAAGLVPIIEPEIGIDAPDRRRTEEVLKAALRRHLDALGDRKVALKLTIPIVDGYYTELTEHPSIARVVALSGGYSRAEAVERLARNPGLIASFSRALLEGLSVDQSAEEFDAALDASIEAIYRASIT